ncbi:MAG: response regulator [Chloroherpetonaceae bacterium]|nr:response regulator [Chloroherpetonaceae bacterium]
MSAKPELLLIDDEPIVLETLKILFKREYSVFTAESGSAAIEVFKQNPNIKLVICDQRMPGMLGHETLREIKSIRPHSIRILLTGYSDLEAVIQSVNSGEVFRYINKPWDSEKLLHVVRLGFQINEKLEAVEREALQRKLKVAEQQLAQSSPPSVLYVSQNGDNAAHISALLGKEFIFRLASSPDTALQTLSQHSISVILSDIDFAEGDPIEFLSAISHEYPNSVAMIYTSIRDAALAIRAINELNVFRYLVRPTDDTKLISLIREAANLSKLRENQLSGNASKIGKDIAPEHSDTSFLKRRIESSPYLLRLRALRANS